MLNKLFTFIKNVIKYIVIVTLFVFIALFIIAYICLSFVQILFEWVISSFFSCISKITNL